MCAAVSDEAPTIVQDLARIYHYYLHGKSGDLDLPLDDDQDDKDEDGEEEEDAGGDGGERVRSKRGRGEEGAAKPKIVSGGASATPFNPHHQSDASAREHGHKKMRVPEGSRPASHNGIDIRIHAYRLDEEMTSFSLRDVKTVETQLMRRKKSEETIFLDINPAKGKCRVAIYLYYFPFVLEKETRPSDKFEKAETSAIMSCYWQGRWIPYTETIQIGSLPFFPDDAEEKELLKRVRGTIFFPRNMQPKSNKLSFVDHVNVMLQASDEFFTNWLDETSLPAGVKKIKTRVKKWLRECHENFDREISVQEIIEGDFRDPVTGAAETRFKRLVCGKQGQGAEAKVFSEGQKLRVQIQPQVICGEVAYFACAKLPPGRSVTSQATIAYHRHPRRLFGKGDDEPPRHKMRIGFLDNRRFVDREFSPHLEKVFFWPGLCIH